MIICLFVAGIALIVVLARYGNIFHPEIYRLPFPIDANPVIVQQLCDRSIGERDPNLPNVPYHEEFRLKGPRITMTDDMAKEIRTVLSSPSTYKYSEGLCFEPGMTISFGSGPNHVDVLICLLCDSAHFYDSANHEVARHLSPEGRNKLAAIYQRIFKKQVEMLPQGL